MNHQAKPKRNLVLAGAALSTLALLTGTAWADEVTLKSADGTVNLMGDLISFSDDSFIIRTDLGDLRIAANRVRCEGAACPEMATMSGDVVIAGSDTIAKGLMPLLMDGYATFLDAEVTRENAAVEGEFVASFMGEQGFGDALGSYLVSATSSSDAFAQLLENTAQIGMSSRRITPAEARALKAAGAGNMISPAQEHILAVDSLVIIVNPQNTVTEISTENLRKIYSGEITNWKDIGGPDLAISTVTGTPDSGNFPVFQSGVFGEQAAPMLPTTFVAADNEAAASFVNENPGGIAYVGYAFQRGQKPLTLITDCGIGSTPDLFSVKTEEYPLFRRLYLYNREDGTNDLAKAFITFTTSPEAGAVIQQAGFSDLGVERYVNDMKNPRAVSLMASAAKNYEAKIISDMLVELEKADRLSTTFRFRTGSSALDPRGELDLMRLVNYLETQPEGSEITFVGFSDEVGAFEPNQSLSRGRAQQVEKAVRALAGDRLTNVTFRSTGFGEIAPAACNTTEAGRTINRRVETWITKN